MSSFTIKATHKATGEVHEIWCLGNCFGQHQYGYMPRGRGDEALTEKQFFEQYELIKGVS